MGEGEGAWGPAYHALSDRFALPTYAQPTGPGPAGPRRTKTALLCSSSPRRLHTLSRRSSRGNVEASHHSDLNEMVPADCMTRKGPVSIGSVCMHAKMGVLHSPTG